MTTTGNHAMHLWRIALLALLVSASLSWPGRALAQQSGVSITTTATALSVSSGNCLAVNGYRRSLTLDNTANAINIGYCVVPPASASCTAAIGTPPTTTIVAGTLQFWPVGSAPQNAICFIAASGTPSLTIREGQ